MSVEHPLGRVQLLHHEPALDGLLRGNGLGGHGRQLGSRACASDAQEQEWARQAVFHWLIPFRTRTRKPPAGKDRDGNRGGRDLGIVSSPILW